MNRTETLFLVPLEQIDQQILEKLRNCLAEIFPVHVQISNPLALPKGAYNPKRNQYNSSAILSYLLSQIEEYDRLLAVTNLDLFTHGLNFVFGEADIIHRIVIISVIRLRQEFYDLHEDSALFFNRTLKEAVHELGHTYGMTHCPNSKCVMHFSNSLLDTDKKNYKFCENCQLKLDHHYYHY